MTTNKPTKIISGVSEIWERYDAFIIDLWGVTHNGRVLFDEAIAFFRLARQQGKQVLFLSNAPRRQETVHHHLASFGLPRELYLDVVTSGEAAWNWIAQQRASNTLGRACYHLGAGEKDMGMRIGLDLDFVDDATASDFILNTGPEEAITSVEGFADLLAGPLAAGTPMICANPDLSVFRGAVEEICAGSIAEYYEAKGGPVHWFGKPWAQVYDNCLDRLSQDLSGLAKSRILCIGDSFRTDIGGANQNGFDSLVVATGLRGTQLCPPGQDQLDPAALVTLSSEYGAYPTYATVALKP